MNTIRVWLRLKNLYWLKLAIHPNKNNNKAGAGVCSMGKNFYSETWFLDLHSALSDYQTPAPQSLIDGY